MDDTTNGAEPASGAGTVPEDAEGAAGLPTLPTAEPERARRTVRRKVGIGVGVAAVVAAGAVTTMMVAGGSSQGGARTPEAAVHELVTALENEDVLGVLDVMDPFERDALRGAVEASASEAKRLELLDDAFSLGGIAGLEFQVQDLVLETEEVERDVAVVHATDGYLRATFDAEEFPAGGIVRDAIDPDYGRRSDRLVFGQDRDDDGEVDDVFLATVERDGRWYVSLSYTVAEYLRRDAGVEAAEPGQAVAAEGFPSAQEAARALLERAAALDARGVVALAAPGEGDAIARYSSLWLPAMTEALASMKAEGLALSVRDAVWDVREDGDRATATLTSYVLEGTSPTEWFGTGTDVVYPAFDPTVPTVISVYDDGTFVVIPPGDPVPERIDASTPRTPNDEFPEGPTNQAYAENGEVVPYWSEAPATAEPAAPLAFTVTYADGCSTVTGPLVGQLEDSWVFYWTSAERTSEGGLRVCGDEAGALNLLWIPQFWSALQPPPLTLVRHDGRWYVSPLGTLAGIVVDELRSIGSDTSLIDSPIGLFVLGETRQSLESSLDGNSRGDYGDACDAISVYDASGDFVRLVDDPADDLVRQCVDAYWNEDRDYTYEDITDDGLHEECTDPTGSTDLSDFTETSDGWFMYPPSECVVAPATTAPAATTTGG